MAALVTDADIAFLRSSYPLLDIQGLTGQQEYLVMHYLRGSSVTEAARAAGYRSVESARVILRREETQVIMKYLRDREFEDVRITRESITAMFLEAYHTAATAGEKVSAARELGKLHGLYPDTKNSGVNVTINNVDVNSPKKLERMSDDELFKLAPTLARQLSIEESEQVLEGEIDHPD